MHVESYSKQIFPEWEHEDKNSVYISKIYAIVLK